MSTDFAIPFRHCFTTSFSGGLKSSSLQCNFQAKLHTFVLALILSSSFNSSSFFHVFVPRCTYRKQSSTTLILRFPSLNKPTSFSQSCKICSVSLVCYALILFQKNYQKKHSLEKKVSAYNAENSNPSKFISGLSLKVCTR